MQDISPATSEAEQLTDTIAGIEGASVVEGINPISFISGESYKLDLSQYFSDPDDDALVFSHRGGEDLEITYTDTTARIMSTSGYTGKQSVVFLATDTNNQTTESNSVSVMVEKPGGLGSVQHFFAGPMGYILLGVAIGVRFILGMELRKRLHQDDDVDEEL